MHQPDIIEFHRIRNVPEILNVTFDFIRQNFRLFWRALLFFAFPPIAVGVTLFSYFLVGLFQVTFTDLESLGNAMPSFMGALLVSGILCLGGGAMLIGIVHVIAELYRERGPEGFTLDDIWQGCKEIFWMLFWTLFGLEAAWIILGVLAAFIPFGQFGLYVGVAFASLYFPFRIYERRGFIQSVLLSSKLVEGRWWATFGMLWLFYLLMLGLSGVFLIPLYLGIWGAGSGLIDVDQLAAEGSLLRLLGTGVVALYSSALFLLGAVPFLSMIFHYYSQRERKGGVSLREEIERIGAAADA